MNKRRTKKAMKKLEAGRPLTDLERRDAVKAIDGNLKALRRSAEELKKRMPELQDGFQSAIEFLTEAFKRMASSLGEQKPTI